MLNYLVCSILLKCVQFVLSGRLNERDLKAYLDLTLILTLKGYHILHENRFTNEAVNLSRNLSSFHKKWTTQHSFLQN